MNEIQQLTEKVEMLEARCQYLGEVFDALIYSLPDKQLFLELLKQKVKQNDANSLYDQSLSDRQQALVQPQPGFGGTDHAGLGQRLAAQRHHPKPLATIAPGFSQLPMGQRRGVQ